MTKRNYLILFLLALIFAAPGITAYLYYLNPQLLLAEKTNKGELLNPPVLFANIADGKLKWRLVYWYPEQCKADCLREVDKLGRIRLALGRRLYEVDEWLVLTQTSPKTERDLTTVLQDKDIHLLRLSPKDAAALPILGAKPKIFIADSGGYLVLAYEHTTRPVDIYNDIKQLLKKSG